LDYRKYVIALREVAGVGPKTFQQLLISFGSLENIYKVDKEEIARIPRIGSEKAEKIFYSCDKLEEIEKHILFLEEQGIGILTILDENYPQSLRKIDDPPPLLYLKGEFPLAKDKFVALVGTTNPEEKGKREAILWGKALAERDVVVVSGLAKGIDYHCHQGALIGDGKTYAVLGSGLNNIYPKENQVLASEICLSGALLSEYPLNASVSVGQLMARNRIIAGLAQAVVIVETEKKSTGVLNAAQRAYDQGKPLFITQEELFESDHRWKDWGAMLIRGAGGIDLVLSYL
jgi:DNA processing protein